MLRLPLKSLSGLVSQLGYKQFQTKFNPILYSLPVCGHDERRYTFSQPGRPLLKTNGPSAMQTLVLHTSSPGHQKMPKVDLDDIKKEANTMLKAINVKDFQNAPKPIQTLGMAGLIPFVLPPLTMLLNASYLPHMALAQLAYGCTILAFLGGVRWGFTLPPESNEQPSWKNLSVSVIWPLVAWVSLMLPQFLGTITLMAGIGAAAYLDFLSSGFPAWFKSVRLLLSAIALGSLFLMLVLRIIL